MHRAIERAREIEAAIADIRETEARGVTRETLQAIRARLAQLAARTDLFALEDFPPPKPGDQRNSCLYRLSEDADHRFALYANSARGNRFRNARHIVQLMCAWLNPPERRCKRPALRAEARPATPLGGESD